MGELGNLKANEALKVALKDENYGNRLAAIRALDRLGATEQVLEELKYLARHAPEKIVQEVAAEIIGKLGV